MRVDRSRRIHFDPDSFRPETSVPVVTALSSVPIHPLFGLLAQQRLFHRNALASLV
jgi:hypothetical protein